VADLLEIRDLTVCFGRLCVLDGLALCVAKGQRHALIGPNGAGKTTLLNAISGWLIPQAGQLRLDGVSMLGLQPHHLARHGITRASQIPQGFAGLTIREHLDAVWQRGKGWFNFVPPADSSMTAHIEALLADLPLEARADELSHGQRKRLELATALAMSPRLLLLDEPTAGLSLRETDTMVSALRALRVSMLVVEHDMDVVAALADRVSVLHNGSIMAQGTPEQIAQHPGVQAIYLSHAHG